LFFKIIFQVKNADNYGWEPRRVLDQLTDIYLHLDSDVFAQALAADERSFRFELFEEAAVRLERALIKAPLQVCLICHLFNYVFFP
jgi:ubiquitin conjugation factor E4 B